MSDKDTGSDLLGRLGTLESAAAADVMVAMGLTAQVLSPALKPLGAARMAGRAVTAEGRVDMSLAGLPTFGLDEAVHEGAIVLIAAKACDKGALIGDNMIASMCAKGARGFVVDGGVRDAAALRDGGVSVWCRFTSPANAHRFFRYTGFMVPVVLPGLWSDVVVHPGDFVLGDEDGIVVLPAAHAEVIVRDCEIHMLTESKIKEGLARGVSREAATAASGRLKHIKPLTAGATATSE